MTARQRFIYRAAGITALVAFFNILMVVFEKTFAELLESKIAAITLFAVMIAIKIFATVRGEHSRSQPKLSEALKDTLRKHRWLGTYLAVYGMLTLGFVVAQMQGITEFRDMEPSHFYLVLWTLIGPVALTLAIDRYQTLTN